MIKRDFYLNQIVRHMHNGEIKVITGIRRCGKSVLLFELFRDHLLEQGVPEEQIITVELDQRKYYKFRNPITLCEYVEAIVTAEKDKQFYLFIDEVQFTKKVVDSENDDIEVTIYDMLNELKAYKNLDVYVTGSNSKMLSSDIATEFRGRATQIRVYPFSFGEFYSYIGGDERKALEQYMLYGGMPKLLSMTDDQDKKECAYRFNSATSPKTESTPFIGHKPKYTGVIQTTGGQSVWQRRSGLHLQTFRNGSRPRSSAGSIYSGSGFRTGLCAPLAVRRSITPSTAGTCASARSAVSRLL